MLGCAGFATSAETVLAVSADTSRSKRRDPFDSLKPADFVTGPWPEGAPVRLKAYVELGLTDEQMGYHLALVDSIQTLAVDYIEHLHRARLNNEQVAAELGVGVNALRDVRLGTRFPSLRTYHLLRMYVSWHMDADDRT